MIHKRIDHPVNILIGVNSTIFVIDYVLSELQYPVRIPNGTAVHSRGLIEGNQESGGEVVLAEAPDEFKLVCLVHESIHIPLSGILEAPGATWEVSEEMQDSNDGQMAGTYRYYIR